MDTSIRDIGTPRNEQERMSKMPNKYKCYICAKPFAHKQSLNRHMNSHHRTTEKMFNCTECKAKYPNRGNLVRHIRTNHPEKAAILCLEAMKCDPKDTAFIPKDASRPKEALTRSQIDAVNKKKKRPKPIYESDESDFEDKAPIRLTKKDKDILKEFLVMEDQSSTPAKRPKKYVKKQKTTAKEVGTQTEPIALSMEEIIAYCDAVLYNQPQVQTVNAPKVLPINTVQHQPLTGGKTSSEAIRKLRDMAKYLDMPLELDFDQQVKSTPLTGANPDEQSPSCSYQSNTSTDTYETTQSTSSEDSSDEEDENMWMNI